MMLDLYALYSFLRRLTTPFDKWEAYKLGIIDGKGKILKKTRDTAAERNAFGAWDRVVLRIKRLLMRVPAGDSAITSYAAALYLIRESNREDYDEDRLFEEITNSVGAGGVAGLGATPDDMPPVPKKSSPIMKRKLPEFSEFVKEELAVHKRRLIKHTRGTIPVTEPSQYDDEEDEKDEKNDK